LPRSVYDILIEDEIKRNCFAVEYCRPVQKIRIISLAMPPISFFSNGDIYHYFHPYYLCRGQQIY